MIARVTEVSAWVRRIASKPIGKDLIIPVTAVMAIAMWIPGTAHASVISSTGRAQWSIPLTTNVALRQGSVGLIKAVKGTIGDVPATGLPNPTVGSLGYSVAVSDDVAVVGAPGDNNGAGEICFYKQVGRSWLPQANFTDPRNQSLDEFGWSVAISSSSAGTYAAVGASAGNGNFNIVYIYTLSHGKWSQQKALPDPGASNQDNFGDSVAITSNTLVVGSPCVGNERGRLFVWLRFDQSWEPEATVSNPANKPNQWFGESVSISGDNILAGAVDSAYIFTRETRHHWVRTATLHNPGSVKDYFGWNVSLSGATAAIGAPGGIHSMVIASPLSTGATYVFTLRGRTWSSGSKISPPRTARGDQFGYSVALAGNSMLIGMPLYGSSACGTAYEFELSGSKWVLKGSPLDPHCAGNAEFGFAVAQSGSSGAIGAPDCNALHGAVTLGKVS